MSTNEPVGSTIRHQDSMGLFCQLSQSASRPTHRIKNQVRRAQTTFLLILLSSVSLFASVRELRLDQLVHTSWTAQAGAPGAIHALAQTADGYLWLGTDAGLFRFDGVRFVHVQGSLPARAVASLLATSDGKLWIGFAYGGISVLDDGLVTTYSESDGLPTTSVMSLAVDQSGTLWAGTGRGGLAYLRGNKWTVVGKEYGFHGEAWSLKVDSYGTLWVSGGHTLASLAKGSTEFKVIDDPMWYVLGTDRSRDGRVWITDLDNGGSVRPLESERGDRHNLGTMNRFASTAFMFDSHGSLWVTTLGSGLRRIKDPDQDDAHALDSPGRKLEAFTEKDGLTSDYIQAILEDREGNIWIGTNQGLDEFHTGAVIPVAFPSGSSYFSMAAGNGGVVWTTPSNRHLYRILDGKIDEEIKGVTGITASFRGRDGTIWMANGPILKRLVGDRLVNVKIDNLESVGQHQSIAAICEDADGRLWISIRAKGVFRLDGSKLTSLQSMGGPPGSALAIFGDALGRVWFGIGKSLVELNNNRAQEILTKDGIRIGAILAVQGDGSNVWVGGESGLAFSDGTAFSEITGNDGLEFRAVSGIVATSNDGVWMSESRGVIHIPQSEIEKLNGGHAHALRYRLFDAFDGLPAPLQANFMLPSAIEGTDGLLWFATTKGLAWVDPAHVPRNSVVPPVSVESLESNGVSYFPPSLMKIPQHTRDVQIDYAALSLTIPSRVRFRYRLRGFEDNWIEAGNRRTAYFTGLGPGKYEFDVIACNNDGVWNERGATLNFTIDPAWYQTSWFMAACALLFMLAGWIIYRLRVRQIATALSARFDERLAERIRLARELHDTFLQTVQGSKMVVDDALDVDADESRMRHALEKLSRWLGQAVDEGRAALHSLRVSTIEKNHLSEALQRATEDHQLPTSMTVAFSVIGDPRDVHPIVRDEIYRIGYEAIRNAAAHSRGSRLEVDIHYASDLMLRIKDNGLGIQPDLADKGREGHFGLQGMRERATRIRGKLSIVSSANAGTEVTLVVPGVVVYRNEHPSFVQRFKGALKRLIKSSPTDRV